MAQMLQLSNFQLSVASVAAQGVIQLPLLEFGTVCLTTFSAHAVPVVFPELLKIGYCSSSSSNHVTLRFILIFK